MLSIGFSPCPNDTFIFHGLVNGLVGEDCACFKEPVLADVETLNTWAFESRLDVTKISFHALGHVLDDYVLLHSGSALGRGCGPLLVGREMVDRDDLEGQKIAIPGKHTTAAMLLQLFLPGHYELVAMPFEKIMPSVAVGKVDYGVIIHESRFTYQQHGLVCLQDLGSWWEKETGHPIPLGGIVARRSLGRETLLRIDHCIKKSVQCAFSDRKKSETYIKKHAQELDDHVIRSHIDLYVNSFSEDLGTQGMKAINEFLLRGKEAGIFAWKGTEFVLS
ncbi:MAG: 1,4-dihydroxy-6-naphthoate synthase [Desulfobulbaceae bacterium]|nr:1,4-dihydroxy-6-naphthoate synthase [Desulfobulbaceae bacterium]